MSKSIKTALCAILGACIIAAALAGCAQAGDQRALDPNNAGNNGLQNQGYTRNGLLGGRYGYNRLTGNTANTGSKNGNMRNDPSNFLSYNGVKTIENNNRFSRTGNTGMGNNARADNLTGSGTANTANGNDTARASKIERQLESIGGVNDCTVLVSGDTALVGLRTNGTGTAGRNISGLKTTIERKVKQIDSSIRNVVVTDSTDMLTRMGRLGTAGNRSGTVNSNITTNRNGTMRNFMQEFDDIIRSIRNMGR